MPKIAGIILTILIIFGMSLLLIPGIGIILGVMAKIVKALVGVGP